MTARPVVGQDSDIVLTRHARLRMTEMGVTLGEISHAIRRPAQSWFGRGRWTMQHGRIAVGLVLDNNDHPVVLTVLWRNDAEWLRQYEGGKR